LKQDMSIGVLDHHAYYGDYTARTLLRYG